MKLQKIIEITQSQIASDIDLTQSLIRLNTLDSATGEELSFFHKVAYVKELEQTKAKAVILKEEDLAHLPKGVIAIINPNPYIAMAKLTRHYFNQRAIPDTPAKIGANAHIDENVHIGKGCVIGEGVRLMHGAYIGHNVHIGDNAIIHPNVAIYDDTMIGSDTIIHANTTIGSDGFGFVEYEQKPLKLYHLGRVEIGDFVEIGANTAIDRALLGVTKIDDYCKFDNLVHIGHNCTFGKFTAITAQNGFSGSTKIGQKVLVYGQSGFAGHLNICDEVVVMGRSGVTKDINEKGVYAGFPAQKYREWVRKEAKLSAFVKKR